MRHALFARALAFVAINSRTAGAEEDLDIIDRMAHGTETPEDVAAINDLAKTLEDEEKFVDEVDGV